ncbi:unnamed protein product [Urochloa humidicola]
MLNDLANFEAAAVAAPAEYRRFTFRDLYMRRTYCGPGANQAVVVNPSGGGGAAGHCYGLGATVVHNWAIYDGPGPDAKLVARARGLHIDTTGAGLFYNTFCFMFEHGRFKGSTLQAMGVAPKSDDEYSIVGGSGEFALANGVVNRVVHSREGNTDIDRLTIKGFIPVMRDSHTAAIPGSSTMQSLATKIGPWGGNGGSDADVRVSPHRLESVVIRHGVVVDAIGFSYLDQTGRRHAVGPWGGNGGNITTIPLALGEFIREVSGTIGMFGPFKVVTSINLVSNLQTYGPYGQPKGTDFSVPVQGDNGVVGFFGRSGIYLDAIGVYARP